MESLNMIDVEQELWERMVFKELMSERCYDDFSIYVDKMFYGFMVNKKLFFLKRVYV